MCNFKGRNLPKIALYFAQTAFVSERFEVDEILSYLELLINSSQSKKFLHE